MQGMRTVNITEDRMIARLDRQRRNGQRHLRRPLRTITTVRPTGRAFTGILG
jgi:hypothetical protein